MSGADYVAVFKAGPSTAANLDRDTLALPQWSDEDWRKLLAHTVPQRFRASEMVIQRGAADRALYFVAAGSVEVGVYRSDGAAIAPVARLGIGSVIGEQPFFDGQPGSTNAWAVSDGELLRLAPEAFGEFARAEPALARDFLLALGRVLSLRLRNLILRGKRV
jgi:CRP/FNR family transcriptional regulator, cyclic AMP receptor protein